MILISGFSYPIIGEHTRANAHARRPYANWVRFGVCGWVVFLCAYVHCCVRALLRAFRFSTNEGDGKVARDVSTSENAMKNYVIYVHTGDIKGAGTDATVFIKLFGKEVHESGCLFVCYLFSCIILCVKVSYSRERAGCSV